MMTRCSRRRPRRLLLLRAMSLPRHAIRYSEAFVAGRRRASDEAPEREVSRRQRGVKRRRQARGAFIAAAAAVGSVSQDAALAEEAFIVVISMQERYVQDGQVATAQVQYNAHAAMPNRISSGIVRGRPGSTLWRHG